MDTSAEVWVWLLLIHPKTPLTVISANAELLAGKCREISADVD